MGVIIDLITIVEDVVPETDEVFFISFVVKDDHSLNIFPQTLPIEVTIQDNDGKAFSDFVVKLFAGFGE